MRHRILIVLLALGTVGGFGSGFASLRHRHSQCHAAWSTNTASPSGPISPTGPEAPVPPGPR